VGIRFVNIPLAFVAESITAPDNACSRLGVRTAFKEILWLEAGTDNVVLSTLPQTVNASSGGNIEGV